MKLYLLYFVVTILFAVVSASADAEAGVLSGPAKIYELVKEQKRQRQLQRSKVNGEDVLGLRICEVADLVKNDQHNVTLLLWRTGLETSCDPETLCCGPMPLNLERLSSCMQLIFTALECPVCMDTVPPPCFQCINGHLICLKCRKKTEKCPMCREKYIQTRSLISEQIHNSIREIFKLEEDSSGKLRERLFGATCQRSRKKDNKAHLLHTPTNRFLAKVIGKATSMDNVTNSSMTKLPISKQLSLSADDVSGNEGGPTAVLEHNKTSPTSEVLKSRPKICRPVSLNNSTDNLDQLNAVMSSRQVTSDSDILFRCPTGRHCQVQSTTSSLAHHVQVHHNTPIICFGTSYAEISIPPKEPVNDASLIVLLNNKQFWLKLRINEDGSIFTSAFLQGFGEEGSQYMLEARIRNRVPDKLLQRELTMRSIVHPLTATSWQDTLERRMGVNYDSGTLRAAFSNEKDLILRLEMKYRNE